jgi:hypothetical protein
VLEEEQAVLSNKNKIISLKKGSKWTYWKGYTFLSFSTLSKSFYPYALVILKNTIDYSFQKVLGSGFQLASLLIV